MNCANNKIWICSTTQWRDLLRFLRRKLTFVIPNQL
jgi:hypothetical protein